MTTYDLAVCNTMAGSNASTGRGCRILSDTLDAFPEAVITGVVEASNLLGTKPGDWTPNGDPRLLKKIQGYRLDKAGVAAIYDARRVQVTRIRYRRGVSPYIHGRRIGMRTRWVLVVRARVDGGKSRPYKFAHFPPKRFWALWPAMVPQVGTRGAVLGDFNKLARVVAPALGRNVAMDRLIGIATPKSWRVSNKRVADVQADHKAVGVTVHQP